MLNPTNQNNAGFLEVPFSGSLSENQSFIQTNAGYLEVPFDGSLPENQSFIQTNTGFLEFPFDGSLPDNQSLFQTNAGFLEVPLAGLKNQSLFLTTTAACDSLQERANDSGLTCNEQYWLPNLQIPPDHFRWCQNQIDSIISQHMMKIRLELEESQKQQTRLMISAMVKKMKEKDEQILRIEELNLALQERLNNILLENQMWRNIAQSNEATLNSLCTNLEQALVQSDPGDVEEDAESCCMSSDDGDKRCSSDRICKMCRERESSTVVMPCRHLCLCSVCESGLQTCPVCNASMNATLHVNLSPF